MLRPIRKITLAILGCAVGLVVFELGLRVLTGTGTMAGFRSNVLPIYEATADGRPFSLRRNFNYPARFNCAWTKECVMNVRLNDMGLREDRNEAQLLDHDFKILAMGDSFTFGYGVNQGERYSDLLNTLLAPRATAFSAGYADGHSPVDYEVYLRVFFDKIKPDIVIVGFYPENDLVHDVRARLITRNERHEIISSKLANGFRVVDGFIARAGSSRLGENSVRVKNWLWEHFAIYRLGEMARNLVRYKLHPERQAEALPRALFGEFPETERQEVEATLGALKSMNDFLRSKGKTLVVFLLPSAFQLSDYYDRIWYDRPGHKVDLEMRQRARQVLEPQTFIAKWCDQNGIRCLDPTIELKRRDREGFRLYYDSDGHWNKNGHRVAFELLSEYLVTNRLIPSEYLASPVQVEAMMP